MKKCQAILWEIGLPLAFTMVLLSGCVGNDTSETARDSLVAAEEAFCQTALQLGVREAFLVFLHEDAIVFRPKPVNGRKWFQAQPASSGQLSWKPIFAQVSRAGDLGYTTGPWEFRPNPADSQNVIYGQYVSVWSKLADGQWKVMLDAGISHPQPLASSTEFSDPELHWPSASQLQAPPSTELNGIQELEAAFSQAAARMGSLSAARQYFSADIRLLLEGASPFLGKDSALTALSTESSIVFWRPQASFVARSQDLGYTYGTYALPQRDASAKPVEAGSYLHIWRHQTGGWLVALEIRNPFPQSASEPVE